MVVEVGSAATLLGMNTHRTFAPEIEAVGLAGRRFTKAKALAAKLGVCPRTLFRWANAGQITRHKVNARVVLFDEAEVAAFIDSARVGCR
jgi:hypothetical protein